MHYQNIVNALRELDIDTGALSLDSRLEADLGLDSQEIVELRAALDQRYRIQLPERELRKTSTLRDLIGWLEKLAPKEDDPEREYSCEARAVIQRPRGDVYEALFRLEDWPRHLPHVLGVNVLYDDGRYQEFTMRVASKTSPLEVRSVRDCDGAARIDFFQPQPPPYLRHHSGGWRFEERADGSTEVHTFHRWRLNPGVARELFPHTGVPVEEQVRDVLLEHARLALSLWKSHLESQRRCA
ncbi:phosphopantetheine-binding protein [Myxococcus sp. RHSTA-1-4]|uniref:phosphopantetheine-binding protein n=1 Tax=Myxococcus sp. RHSTA-1-4 TaxID=2874601 RepID=UPI001CBBD710|nr:phosphopantetheine-binding protein [Myxococcus sp. RHSTA-1-4]MBZ4417197.1 hypothetical protein [Myxococcus sp. RHSTA-1-4]